MATSFLQTLHSPVLRGSFRIFERLRHVGEHMGASRGLRKWRTVLVASVYVAVVAISNYLAFWLRFDGAIPAEQVAMWVEMLLPLVALNGIAYFGLGLDRGLWRDTSIWDLRDLVFATAVATVIFSLYVHLWRGLTAYPRSVFVVGGILSICLFGGIRLARRIASEGRPSRNGNRVLIVGAGDAGALIARDLRKKGHRPIGFIDDDATKRGRTIHGVKVLGGRKDLARIVTLENPDQVLIAIPSAGPATIRRFIYALERFKVPIMTLPGLREIVDGRIDTSHVRGIEVRDLLARSPIHLDSTRARELVEGRRILVTGAGGSIGSELCRQIVQHDPDRLILYERYENNLYSVLNTLPRGFRTQAALGDVTDRRRLHDVMREYRPDILFHAAAHKHVPLMELNPCEAVKNNVIGTRMMAEAAIQFDVERFILISTDKAVNPTSLMGATKRAAELVIQSFASGPGPRFAIVRFGNVLGSNGSVIPRWLEQIAAGGPVTVTHPEARRFFMLIPEAVALILQAAAITRGGEIFALEMGEQINLLNMARDLIRMSGFIPDEEIAIQTIGLRPGEKLTEELVGPGEQIQPSPLQKIVQLKPSDVPDPHGLMARVALLGTLAQRGHTMPVIELLRVIVPTFEPDSQLMARLAGGARGSVRRATPPRGREQPERAVLTGTATALYPVEKSHPGRTRSLALDEATIR
jgi:FlaA1/EpsC-like NDP-sugar epimerase